MFLVNSRLGLVSATPLSSAGKRLHRRGPTFSRGYGGILPSSLTRVLSSALGYSPCLPVSVCGTVALVLARGFSRQCGISGLPVTSLFRASSRLGDASRICLRGLPTRLNRDIHHTDRLSLCVPPSLITNYGGTGIFACFPSATPFGLALGTD